MYAYISTDTYKKKKKEAKVNGELMMWSGDLWPPIPTPFPWTHHQMENRNWKRLSVLSCHYKHHTILV